MKKSLIITLALVFVLGIAGTAFAANPFVDVPANHWAYGAVSKLAKAGIVNGMGDGTYQGSANMTRYEMAQIVAKAMTKVDSADAANKALIEKLEAEFAAELNNLGVRVKNLEAKVGSIAMSGDARLRYLKDDNAYDASTTAERVRLYLKATVNENTTFFGRVAAMSDNEFGDDGDTTTLKVLDANFTTKNLFNSDVTATIGRFSQNLLQVNHIAGTTGMVDGAKVMFGNKVNMTLGYADFAPCGGNTEEAFFAAADYALSKSTKISAMYLNETNAVNYDIWGVGFKSTFANDWYVAADYSKNTAAVADDAVLYVGRVGYKAANKAVVGSWGAYVEYLKAEQSANDKKLSGASVAVANVKGWNVKFESTLAKNIVLEAWQTFNQKVASGVDAGTDAAERTRVQISYYF